MSKITYRPEIDGLRAVAVLPVILYHVNHKFLPGGYLGVDVFFVISGFLITTIILKELEKGNFSLVGFWNRRIKRILPAALFVITVSTVANTYFFYHPDLSKISMHKIASLFSFANIYFWVDLGSYWGKLAEKSPYLHFWSLSVEEQYYIFYPVLLLIIHKFLKQKYFVFIFVISITSFALFVFGIKFFPIATFYLLPARVWELGVGCLLAISNEKNKFKLNKFCTLAGLILIVLMYVLAQNIDKIGLEAFVVVLATALIIAPSSNQITKIFLENKISVFIGKISYSLYLWHWIVIIFLLMLKKQYGIPLRSVHILGITLVSSTILSIFSYYFIEQKFKKMRYGAFIALCWFLILTIFIALEKKVLQFNYAKEYFAESSWHGTYYDLKLRDPDESLSLITINTKVPKKILRKEKFRTGGIITKGTTKFPQIVVLGDSHGATLCQLIRDIIQEQKITASFWTMNGVSPHLGVLSKRMTKKHKEEYDSARLHYIQKWKPKIVIISANSARVEVSTMLPLLDFLGQNSSFVVYIESPPRLKIGNRSAANFLAFKKARPNHNNQYLYEGYLEHAHTTRKKLIKLQNTYSNFYFLPVVEVFTLEDKVLVGHDKTVYYLDDDHLTYEGTLLLKERISSVIKNLMNNEKYSKFYSK